mmetsp:Transcript_17269/g.51725  ORF Transcript_17269/g.51725 Transcript_17269/m.51725 type:complete len:244 (-) Transcript_17269:2707-3438(-)
MSAAAPPERRGDRPPLPSVSSPLPWDPLPIAPMRTRSGLLAPAVKQPRQRERAPVRGCHPAGTELAPAGRSPSRCFCSWASLAHPLPSSSSDTPAYALGGGLRTMLTASLGGSHTLVTPPLWLCGAPAGGGCSEGCSNTIGTLVSCDETLSPLACTSQSHSPPLMAPAHISSSSAMHGMARLQHCAGATPLAVATVAGEGGWFCQKVSPDAPLWVLQSSVQRSWPWDSCCLSGHGPPMSGPTQ